MSVGCDGVRVCGGELCSRYHVYEKPLGCECRRGNAVRVVRSSSDAKERHRRPCTQEDIGCLLTISGQPAACSLFLADQRQRYYSIMSACARASSSFATRPRPHHVMAKYWRNLIWRCVHNPPNRQIKFPAKFSGHTVYLEYVLTAGPIAAKMDQ